MALTRVLLITTPLFSHFVRHILRHNPVGAEIVGAVANTTEALAAIRTHKPHVVIISLRTCSPIDGLEIVAKIRATYPEALIIGRSAKPDTQFILQAGAAGVVGFINLAANATEIATAIQTVRAGGAYLPPQIAQQFVHGLQTNWNPDFDSQQPAVSPPPPPNVHFKPDK